MNNNKGFTLIELAVVLAIIAVLAAVLTPMVTGYLDQARISRAQADLRTIADAIKLHQRDTGRYPIYNNSTDYGSDTAAKLEFATSAGTSGSLPQAGTSGWSLGTEVATTSLELFLNNNYTSVAGTSFPKASFNGPYIGTVDTDPWGHQYLLNGGNLRYKSPNNGNHAYVISAGPNGILETSRDVASTAALAAGGDDVISVIK